MNLQAVIFDFDGVIVDSERLHYEAFNRIVEPLGLGLTLEEYVETYIGFDDRGFFRTLFQKAGRVLEPVEMARLLEAKASMFHRMVSEESPTPFPGVEQLIRSLSGKFPLALCSGALRSDIDPVFTGMKLHGLFDAVVTADDVPASKPDPTCYRMAVQKLADRYQRMLVPACCLAIEDTPVGITAAKGAGLKVLALTNTYDRAYLGLADYVRESLEGVGLAELQGLMA